MKSKYLPSLAIACGLALNFAMPDQANAIGFSFTSTPISINASSNTFTATATAGTPTQLTLNLTSSDLSGLEIFLTSPLGNTLGLVTALNNAGSTTISPTFSDSGSITIDTDTTNPYNGIYRPYNALDPVFFTTTPTVFSFAGFGIEGSGNYTLTVNNLNGGTPTGTLTIASLDVTPTAVPFEFDGSAGIAIVGGAVAFRHWYKKRKKS